MSFSQIGRCFGYIAVTVLFAQSPINVKFGFCYSFLLFWIKKNTIRKSKWFIKSTHVRCTPWNSKFRGEREKFSTENGVVLFIAINFIIKILKKSSNFGPGLVVLFPFGLYQKRERKKEKKEIEREREIKKKIIWRNWPSFLACSDLLLLLHRMNNNLVRKVSWNLYYKLRTIHTLARLMHSISSILFSTLRQLDSLRILFYL